MSIQSEINRISEEVNEQESLINQIATALKGKASGSAHARVVEKDVNFYDYDGTLLYSYTLGEVQNLTALPDLPTQEGLICQEWNWTLGELKALGRPMTVGASYITDDGATRLVLDCFEQTTIPLYFRQTVANGITVDWGDGSATQTVSGTGVVTISHTFAPGKYTVSLTPVGSCALTLGDSSSNTVIGTSADTNLRVLGTLRRVHIGRNANAFSYRSFRFCTELEAVSAPSGMRYTEASAFGSCYNLGFLVVPRGISTLANYLFDGSNLLRTISINPGVESIGSYTLYNCPSLVRLDLPDTTKSLSDNCLRNSTAFRTLNYRSEGLTLGYNACRLCYRLEKVKMSEGQTAVSSNTFDSCVSIVEIDFPSTITSIEASAFAYCYAMRRYDFTKCAGVPTLANANAFGSMPTNCIIVVPDSLLSEWRAATNWNTISAQIKGESEA